ncbi:MAG: hypothetical protein LC802_11090 [Acidobacteria bacterium]|nr:hypothetical protein [Acidobacteriota bacterium]
MPKDPAENQDQYKIAGGQLNEYEFQQNEGAMTEQERHDSLPHGAEGLRGADEPNAPQNVAERIRQLTEQVQERAQRQREKEAAKAAAQKAARRGGAKKSASGGSGKAARGGAKKPAKASAAKSSKKSGGATQSARKSAGGVKASFALKYSIETHGQRAGSHAPTSAAEAGP